MSIKIPLDTKNEIRYKRNANNRFVEIMVDELSPFVLAKERVQQPEIKPEDKPNNPTTPENKTNTPSDETSIGVLTTLLAFTGVALLVTIRKRYN